MQIDFGWRDVDAFWFPRDLEHADTAAHLRMFAWWLGGGSNAKLAPFSTLVHRAQHGGLDHWAHSARGRLALILVLDQFPRGLFPGTPRAYSGDARALELAEEGLAAGHCERLEWPWLRMFMLMPLIHAEGHGHLARARRALDLATLAAERAPPHLLALYRASLAKPREHCDVIARFGRFPHRNATLGRAATADEVDYIVAGRFTHLEPLELG